MNSWKVKKCYRCYKKRKCQFSKIRKELYCWSCIRICTRPDGPMPVDFAVLG